MKTSHTRREIIRGFVSTGFLGLAAVPLIHARLVSFPVVDPPLLLSLVKDTALVFRLGNAYREAHPDESDFWRLYRLLGGRSSPSEIEEKIRQDFRANKVVQLQGWILSITEVRQCALYSLVAG